MRSVHNVSLTLLSCAGRKVALQLVQQMWRIPCNTDFDIPRESARFDNVIHAARNCCTSTWTPQPFAVRNQLLRLEAGPGGTMNGEDILAPQA